MHLGIGKAPDGQGAGIRRLAYFATVDDQDEARLVIDARDEVTDAKAQMHRAMNTALGVLTCRH